MSASQKSPPKTAHPTTRDPGRPAAVLPVEVIWHDLECGSYRVDLPLWRRLAGAASGPILEIGAGTGRVTMELARTGRQVTALDIDPVLLGALRERAAGLNVETVCANACSFGLPTREFGLCLVPMQTLQLLSGAAERAAFLRCAVAHLRPGGLLACALVTELDPFETAGGMAGPSPETMHLGRTLYVSQATTVRVLARHILIERARRIVPSATAESNDSAPAGEPTNERNLIKLARLSPPELEQEAARVGFRPEPALEIESTDEHVGSVVVMLRA